MPHERDEKAPGREESRRGEHNALHYYDADEEQSFDERGTQTEGPGGRRAFAGAAALA